MIRVHLDGELREVSEGSTLISLIPAHPAECAVAIIRPATKEQEKTESITVTTTAGEITLELAGHEVEVLERPDTFGSLSLHWTDRYAAAFGPFPSDIHPERKPHLYERGDVILGCGGYDPKTSYLIFSKSRHLADHGADETGGVVGRVVSGKAVLDRWTTGDRVTKLEPVISWADTSRSFTTTDQSLVLEDGTLIVSHVEITAQGYTPDRITTEAAGSVEHLLIALQSGKFTVDRATSTHILDRKLVGTDVPAQFKRPRREGTVTVRTGGPSVGGVYIYRADVPSSPAHSVVGQVVHGIELVKLAKEGDVLSLRVVPPRIDLLGLPLPEAKRMAAGREITLAIDTDGPDRIVVSQEPGTTLDVLSERSATVTTAPFEKVIDIVLDDARAPLSCDVFRRITGLKEHDAGMMPAFFVFDDVYLFKPKIPTTFKIYPENCPTGEVPGAALAITNDSRKGAGLVGVRLSANREFGPTSEPFEGTNIIGRVIDTDKLKSVKERQTVYIREVKS
ncbi:MAG: methanogenesis marker 3 protein [Methanoregula sp.]|jgi:putative methanogenesis marker protein 3|uniref:methyl-coenzyme M reductase-associated protein Mmp3 n=1 Tax=Methanoregula sp. TaxID=2052170 RepID=UPI003C1E47DF